MKNNYDLYFYGCYAIFQAGCNKDELDFPIAVFMDKADAELYLKALIFKYDGLKIPYFIKEINNTNLRLNIKEGADND